MLEADAGNCMRWMTRFGAGAVLLGTVVACGSSPVDPYVDVVAETVGTEFVVGDGPITIPVSIANVSSNVSYYVWMGPGGLCATLDRLGTGGWGQDSSGSCHPRAVTEVKPGQRLDSQVWMGDETGVFRFRLHVSDEVSPPGVEARERTNPFTIRP